MNSLWKNLRENLLESLWENCGKSSTYFTRILECFKNVWESWSFHVVLREFYYVFYTRVLRFNSLFYRRICTVSTQLINTITKYLINNI